jgi:hypothetical protein
MEASANRHTSNLTRQQEKNMHYRFVGNPNTNEAGRASQARTHRDSSGIAHYCHVSGCKIQVAPKYLMCMGHWRRVPADLQRAVWRTYRPGQEVTKDPSPEYLAAAKAACEFIEGVQTVWGRPAQEIETAGEKKRREKREAEAEKAARQAKQKQIFG